MGHSIFTSGSKIYNQSVEKYGRCDTLAFGFVLGEKKAFLIQNMFPVTEKYFNNVYIDKNTSRPIQLSESLKKELKSKANKVLSLYKRKGIKLVFTDIEKILTKLDV